MVPTDFPITFSSQRPIGYGGYVINADRSNVRDLTPQSADVYAPELSPDGTHLVYTLEVDGQQDIWVQNLESGNAYPLVPSLWNSIDPTWSPDGSQIVFATSHDGPVEHYIVDVDGSNLHQIPLSLATQGGRTDWSPDGQWISYYAGPFGDRDIYISRPDGSDLQRLTSGGHNRAPSFSPDSEWVVFASDRDGDSEIFIMRIDGSEIRQLTFNNYPDWQPRWEPGRPEILPTPTPTPNPFVQNNAVLALNGLTPLGQVEREIGRTVEDRPITETAFKSAEAQHTILLVGGIHGGYEWNSILLAERFIDHFTANAAFLPPSVALHIIPNANPDGTHRVIGKTSCFTPEEVADDPIPGRFNANNVDLNRNWDCGWQTNAFWSDQQVSGGSTPFSEPETQALRDHIMTLKPDTVIWLHSEGNVIFSAGTRCTQNVGRSREQAGIYGEAAQYPVDNISSGYPVTGDAASWLAQQGIPSFTVELATHSTLDWERNLAGLQALIDWFKMNE